MLFKCTFYNQLSGILLILALQSDVHLGFKQPGSCDTGFILRPQLAACQTLKASQHRMCLGHSDKTEIYFSGQRPEGWYGQSQITTGGRRCKLSMEHISALHTADSQFICFRMSWMRLWPPCGTLRHLQAAPALKPEVVKNPKDRCLYLGWLRGGAMGQSTPNHKNHFSMEICGIAAFQRYTHVMRHGMYV